MSIKDIYTVESIKSSETYDWLLHKHYAKRIPSISYAFGLYEQKILIGICTFGTPASHQLCIGVCGESFQKYVLELNRLCVKDNLEKNVLSFFVAKCLKFLPYPKIIVSYADTKMHHTGFIYQATNFLFTGKTVERTDIYTPDGKHSRHYDKKIDYTINRKKRSSKYRYVMFLGNKTQKKNMLKNLKYQVQPYPKGKNKKYDASYNPTVQVKLF